MKMERILDEFEQYICITDIETKELLYLNKAGQERFGTTTWQGKKCHKVFLDSDTPCPFCKCGDIKEEKIIKWEFFNPTIDCQAVLKDIYVKYKGRDAKFQVACDVSEEVLKSKVLESTLKMEQIANNCLKKIYKAKNTRDALPYILSKIGEFLNADRAYIFEIEDNVMNNTYEWCKRGIESQQEFCQNMDLAMLDVCMEKFKKTERCDILDIKNIKSKYPEAYESLAVQNIYSMSIAPLILFGKICGYIGVDNPRCERPEYLSILDTLIYFLGVGFERMETQNALFHVSYHDKLTGLFNRNKYIEDVDAMCVKGHGKLGIIYVDVNGLKSLNDEFGHRHGDKVLIECANILQRIFFGRKESALSCGRRRVCCICL